MDTVKRPDAASTRFENYDCNGGCPVEGALEQISGKWKGMIVFNLLDETLRFNELARQLGTINYEVLCLFGNNNQRKYC